LASLEERVQFEKLSDSLTEAGRRARAKRISELEDMIKETEARFRQLLAAKNE
jgi:hypothetical protein